MVVFWISLFPYINLINILYKGGNLHIPTLRDYAIKFSSVLLKTNMATLVFVSNNYYSHSNFNDMLWFFKNLFYFINTFFQMILLRDYHTIITWFLKFYVFSFVLTLNRLSYIYFLNTPSWLFCVNTSIYYIWDS